MDRVSRGGRCGGEEEGQQEKAIGRTDSKRDRRERGSEQRGEREAEGLWILRPESQDGQSFKGRRLLGRGERQQKKAFARTDSKRGGRKRGSE